MNLMLMSDRIIAKRDLVSSLKRPSIAVKETYYRGIQCQKRPSIQVKET